MVYNDLRSKLNEYNWDDGFEIPKQILAAPSCDLALALEIFYLSDGYAFLDDSTKTTDLKEWGKFIAVLYDDILNDKFPKTSTAFEIPLSQVQKYNLFSNITFIEWDIKTFPKGFLSDIPVHAEHLGLLPAQHLLLQQAVCYVLLQ